jgi:hypothetical protein
MLVTAAPPATLVTRNRRRVASANLRATSLLGWQIRFWQHRIKDPRFPGVWISRLDLRLLNVWRRLRRWDHISQTKSEARAHAWDHTRIGMYWSVRLHSISRKYYTNTEIHNKVVLEDMVRVRLVQIFVYQPPKMWFEKGCIFEVSPTELRIRILGAHSACTFFLVNQTL